MATTSKIDTSLNFNTEWEFAPAPESKEHIEIKEQNELSERYARATYRIGELETTVKFLNEQIKKLESDQSKMQEEHFLKLEEKQSEIKELKAPPPALPEPEPEPPKSWFKKMFS